MSIMTPDMKRLNDKLDEVIDQYELREAMITEQLDMHDAGYIRAVGPSMVGRTNETWFCETIWIETVYIHKETQAVMLTRRFIDGTMSRWRCDEDAK